MKKYTPDERIATFWDKVDKSGGEDACWIWTAGTSRGYGVIRWNQSVEGCHRISYMLAHGDMPTDQFVLHSCDNRRCVNPNHLRLGTHQDNMDDMNSRGRAVHRSGDQHGLRINPDRAARGSRHGGAKLTEADVLRIRERFAAEVSSNKLAREYGVDRSLIKLIVRRKIWKHI